MKILSIAAVGLGLMMAACTPEEQVLVQKWNLVDIPPQMYYCPVVQTYPEVKTLKDSEIAKLLVQLRNNNLTCKASLEAIRQFLADARRTVG